MTTKVAPPADRRPGRRNAIILGIVCVALAGALVYNYLSTKRYEVTPHKRTLADFIVTWHCLACDHQLEDRGDVGPRTCPKCQKDQMYVSIRHACPAHGVFPVAFKYDQEQNPSEVKVKGGEWLPYGDDEGNINTRCPRCGAFMMPAESPRSAPLSDEPE